MKPVYQTRFGYPSGNCFAACVASILELSLDDVWSGDKFDATMQNNDQWWKGWRKWLNGRGYDLVKVHPGVWFLPSKGYAIACGIAKGSQLRHAVVVYNGQLVHDPHVKGRGLEKVESYVIIYPLLTRKERTGVRRLVTQVARAAAESMELTARLMTFGKAPAKKHR